MSILEDFFEMSAELGTDKNDLFTESGNGFTLVSFLEGDDEDRAYNVALVFYDDDAVEIYIRQSLEGYNELALLRKLNELNAEYCGVSFFVDDSLLSAKSYCDAGSDIVSMMAKLVQCMNAIKDELPKLLG